MATTGPTIFLARHGETEWSLTGRHTGHTDLPLTAQGEENARLLGRRLARFNFRNVLTSPLERARQTCELAGFAHAAQVDDDLLEWDYGAYEGLTLAQIRAKRPDWVLFKDGCPDGEGIEDVRRRADRLVERLRAWNDNVLIFSSGHFLRALAIRWCDLPLLAARRLSLRTASLSMLGYDHNLDEPTIRLWNDVAHLDA